MNSPARRFGLADIMVVTAATAVGIAWSRDILSSWGHLRWSFNDWPYPQQVMEILLVSVPWLTVATIAWLVLQLRTPRPGIQRLASQPGAVACGAVFAFMIHNVVLILFRMAVRAATGPIPPLGPNFPQPNLFCNYQVGSGLVAAAWGLLATGGRWRPEPTWLDRAGRLIGLAWIALWVVFNGASVISY